jgi:hypothetical protein
MTTLIVLSIYIKYRYWLSMFKFEFGKNMYNIHGHEVFYKPVQNNIMCCLLLMFLEVASQTKLFYILIISQPAPPPITAADEPYCVLSI